MLLKKTNLHQSKLKNERKILKMNPKTEAIAKASEKIEQGYFLAEARNILIRFVDREVADDIIDGLCRLHHNSSPYYYPSTPGHVIQQVTQGHGVLKKLWCPAHSSYGCCKGMTLAKY
jgi:hypothetical protein